MRNFKQLLTLGVAALTLSTSAQAAPGVIDTIAGRLTAEDLFVSTENAGGVDTFRPDERNWEDFDILFAAVVLDSTLLAAVTDPATSATLFAPNDRAFQLLAFDLTRELFLTEQEVLDVIVGAVNSGVINLTNVLSYHVVGSKVELAQVPLNTPVATLNGDTILFRTRFNGNFVELVDNIGRVRNPFLVSTDLAAGNSVVHSISRILIPVNVNG